MKLLNDKVIYMIGTGAKKISYLPKAIKELTDNGALTYTILSDMGKNIAGASLKSFDIPNNTIVNSYSKQEESLPLEDIVLVAPCTFNTLNKLAAGIADSYPLTITSTAIGAKRKVVVAPAMQKAMWEHPIIGDSVRKLEQWGVKIIWPEIKDDYVTMAPIEKVTDTIYQQLVKTKYLSHQVQIDDNFVHVVKSNYSEFRKTGEFMLNSSLTKGYAGCIAKRVGNNILVSSTGSQIGSLSENELSLLLNYQNNEITWQGFEPPSSESPLILELLDYFPNYNAIAHGHSLRMTYDSKMNKYATSNYVRYGQFGENYKIIPLLEENDGFVILNLHGEIALGSSLAEASTKLYKRLEEAHE